MQVTEVQQRRDDLDRLMDLKVRAATRLAYDHNEFLHGLFKSAGINPHTDISGRSDLLKAYKKGVRTSSQDVAKCYADYAAQLPLLEIWSSGSSGKPKKFLLSKDALERWNRGFSKAWSLLRVADGEKILVFPAPPPHMTSLSYSLTPFLNSPKVRTLVFRVPSIPKSLAAEEKERLAQSYIDMIYDFNPDHVSGAGWAMDAFARMLVSYGLSMEKLRVKTVSFGGDPTPSEQRKSIGELWRAEPFDAYATSEAAMVGCECHSHSGIHINEDDIFLTTVDPQAAEEVARNEVGKDLCTNLYNEGELPATFIINYSHNDNLALLSDKCTCGEVTMLASHPTRDFKKKPIAGFGFDMKEKKSLVQRAARKVRRAI